MKVLESFFNLHFKNGKPSKLRETWMKLHESLSWQLKLQRTLPNSKLPRMTICVSCAWNTHVIMPSFLAHSKLNTNPTVPGVIDVNAKEKTFFVPTIGQVSVEIFIN